jgi:MFS family permease
MSSSCALAVSEMGEVAGEPHAPASPLFPARRGLQMLLLTLAASAGTFARTAIGPLQETMRSALALSDNQLALLQGPALAVPLVIAAVPLGLIIDRYSRVRLLLIFTGLNMIGNMLTAIAPNFASLFAARSLIGLTAFAVNPVVFSLLADLYVPSQRGRATMVIVTGQFVGMASAFALGGGLLAMFGSGRDGLRSTLVWLTVPLVLVTLALLQAREPARIDRAMKNPSIREAWPELWSYRAVIAPLLVGVVTIEIAIGAVFIWAAPALSRAFTVSPDRIGAIMGIGLILSGVLGPIVGGTLGDFCHRTGGPNRTLSVLSMLAILSVPAGLFALMPSVASAGVLLVIFAVLISAGCVMGTTLFTIVIPNELRGLCMAILTAACVLFGNGMAPLIVSLLSGAMGGPAMIGKALTAVAVVSSLLGAAMFAFGGRYFRPSSVL